MSGKTRPSQRAKVLSNVDYTNLSYTDKKFIRDMFALVDEQQAEIEVLVEDTLCLRDTLKENESLRAEIERLQTEKDKVNVTRCHKCKNVIEQYCEVTGETFYFCSIHNYRGVNQLKLKLNVLFI